MVHDNNLEELERDDLLLKSWSRVEQNFTKVTTDINKKKTSRRTPIGRYLQHSKVVKRVPLRPKAIHQNTIVNRVQERCNRCSRGRLKRGPESQALRNDSLRFLFRKSFSLFQKENTFAKRKTINFDLMLSKAAINLNPTDKLPKRTRLNEKPRILTRPSHYKTSVDRSLRELYCKSAQMFRSKQRTIRSGSSEFLVSQLGKYDDSRMLNFKGLRRNLELWGNMIIK